MTRDEAFTAVVETLRVSRIADNAFNAAAERYAESRTAAADAAMKLQNAKMALMQVLEEEAREADARHH